MAVLTVSQAIAKMNGKADRAVRALALELSRRVILRTPVDTGRARGNWQGSLVPHPERRPQWSESAPDPAGLKTIADIFPVTRKFDMGQVFFLANGLPYINRLEHGWSRQAPAGMLRVSINELRPVARQIAAKLRIL